MTHWTQTLRAQYERLVLPRALDWACGLRRFEVQRQRVVPLARGEVLEIGIGTGLNLPHYNRQQVSRITGVDPASELHERARQRALAAGLEVQLVPLMAETLPFADASFDTVLVTYALCTIADPMAALREMRRVLKPQGRLLYAEHGLAPEPAVQRRQRLWSPYWQCCAGGCQLDRDIPQLIRCAGFELLDAQASYIPGPRPFTYNYWGQARALCQPVP